MLDKLIDQTSKPRLVILEERLATDPKELDTKHQYVQELVIDSIKKGEISINRGIAFGQLMMVAPKATIEVNNGARKPDLKQITKSLIMQAEGILKNLGPSNYAQLETISKELENNPENMDLGKFFEKRYMKIMLDEADASLENININDGYNEAKRRASELATYNYGAKLIKGIEENFMDGQYVVPISAQATAKLDAKAIISDLDTYTIS